MIYKILSASILSLMFIGASYGDNCSVKNNGQIYTDVQSAIDAATAGDTLRVSGKCFGSIIINKNLTIKGPATLDAQNIFRVVTVQSGTTVKLLDLKIQNGAIPAGSAAAGAGIFNAGNLTVKDSKITKNTNSNFNAIVFNNSVGTIHLTNVVISDNIDTAFRNAGNAIIEKSKIKFNETGIVNNGILTILDTNIKKNESTILPGGIFNGVNATLNLIKSNVSKNSGTPVGGIFNLGTLNITKSNIKKNVNGDCLNDGAGTGCPL